MRINVYANGFQLTQEIRTFAEFRVLSALGQFEAQIESVIVHLEAGRSQPATAVCRLVVRRHHTSEIHARAEGSQIHDAIDRATAATAAQLKQQA
jgi:ribosomal subunit interface protein